MTRIVIEIEPATARLLVELALALGALEVVEEPATPFVEETEREAEDSGAQP